MRFIRENAFDDRTEQMSEFVPVFFVRTTDKRAAGFRIQKINIMKIALRSKKAICLLGCTTFPSIIRSAKTCRYPHTLTRCQRPLKAETLNTQRGIARHHQAAGKPARPTVLIVQPYLQALFPRFVGGDLHSRKPLFRKIRGFQPTARVNKKTRYFLLCKALYLATNLPFIEDIVPCPKNFIPVYVHLILSPSSFISTNEKCYFSYTPNDEQQPCPPGNLIEFPNGFSFHNFGIESFRL